MKYFVLILCSLFLSRNGIAQNYSSLSGTPSIDYTRVDEYVLDMHKKYKTIPDLAKAITEPFTTDEEKVRAIFRWITDNISYDYVELKNKKKSLGAGVFYNSKTSKSEIDNKWENIYYNYATRVLRSKKGICEGYSTLFYELCKYSGINCEMVSGFADNNITKVNFHKYVKVLSTNHAWNKVLIDGEWLYLDVTWASGFCDDKTKKFTKHFNPEYYLVPESKLYGNHVVNAKRTQKRNSMIGNY